MRGIRRLLEAILLLGSARGCGLIVTLVRQKVLSIVLGRAGMGVLGLLRQFLDPMTQILPLGMNAGVVKFVAKYRGEGNERALRGTVSTAAWFFLAVSSGAALVVLIFARPLALQILGVAAYRHLIILVAVSLPLTILAGYFNALLVGAERITTITYIHYAGHAVTLAVGIPLIVVFHKVTGTLAGGLTGAVVSLVALEGFYCAAYGLMAARHVPVNLRSFGGRALFRLSGYGAATLADVGLWMFVLFLARWDFSKRYGDETQGLFEIIYRLSFQYMGILLFVINTYVFPRVSALSDDSGIAGEINTALRGLWLLLIPIAVALSLLIKPAIWLIWTSEFYDSAAFLPWQLVGDIYYLSWATMGLALLGRGRLGAYVAVGVTRNVGFLAVYAAIRWLAGRGSLGVFPTTPESLHALSGWQGLVWAYAASSLLAVVLGYVAMKRLYGFHLTRDNRFLVGFSSIVMLPVLFLPNWGPVWVGAKMVALVVWVGVVVRRAEWSQGLSWIGELARRGNRR